jgi:enoyl-CoA hydratase/carnithine racemase
MEHYNTERLDVDRNEDVVRVTIANPAAHNALTTDTVLDLQRVLDAVQLEGDVDVLVLTGDGDSAFSSGADIEQHAGDADEQFHRTRNELTHELFTSLRDLHAPVIARINGHCVGAGLGLALFSDVRVGVPTGKYGIPPVKIGEVPTAGVTHRLLAVVGEHAAKDLVLTGRLVDGERALALGIVDRLVEPDALDEEVNEIVTAIQGAGSGAVKNAKALLNEVADAPNAASARDLERERWWTQFDTEERRRMVDGFLE